MTPSVTLTGLLVPVYLLHHLLPLLLHHGTQLGYITVLVVLTLEVNLDFTEQKPHVSDITTCLSAVGYFRVLSLFVRQPYEPIPAITA